MLEMWMIIGAHQLIFQGMFVFKNMRLYRKTGKPIRGRNIEATLAIAFFVVFIGAALALSVLKPPIGNISRLNPVFATITGVVFLCLNLVISLAALIHLRDSWRVGVLEDQQTDLVTTGIYAWTRNPYFVAYILMFAAYTVLLQNVILLGLSIVGCLFIHRMILTEETYLHEVHGDAYLKYKQSAPRYLFF